MNTIKKILFLNFLFCSLIIAKDFKILKYQEPAAYDFPEHSMPEINNIGTHNKEIEFTKIIGGQKIYSYIAHHNPYGFRVFPEIETHKKENKKLHLIFSGCSFTYGQGLEDQKTFSYKIATSNTPYIVYNMGLLGGRITDQIYDWRVYNMKKYISEESGIFIYTLFNDHLNRTNNDYTYLNWIKPQTPDYEVNGDDLKLIGSIQKNSKYAWMQYLKKKNLDIYWLRLVSHFRNFRKKQQIDRMIFELNILKKEYLTSFPKGRFVIAEIFPFPFLENEEDSLYFKTKLLEQKIEFWENDNEKNYPEVQKVNSEFFPGKYYNNYEILGDGHPNEMANEEYYKFLMTKIQ